MATKFRRPMKGPDERYQPVTSVPVPTIMHTDNLGEGGKLFRGVIPTDGIVQDVILDIGRMNRDSARIIVSIIHGDVDNSVNFRVEKGRNEYPVPIKVKKGSIFIISAVLEDDIQMGDVSLGFALIPRPVHYMEKDV